MKDRGFPATMVAVAEALLARGTPRTPSPFFPDTRAWAGSARQHPSTQVVEQHAVRYARWEELYFAERCALRTLETAGSAQQT